MTTRRDYTLSVIVEHVSGPERAAHWEGTLAALLEDLLEDNAHLHTEDDATYRIVQAAVAVAVPLAQALALREAADEASAWSGAAEWLRERAYRIQAAGENRREAHRSAMRREWERRQIIVTVLCEDETNDAPEGTR